ncbi:MAG: hypothetical protein AB7S38_41100 [Vulcanimicrobiota bacterium]
MPPGTFRPADILPGKAWTLALVLVVLANLLVLGGQRAGYLSEGVPRALIREFDRTTREPAKVWLIGNSTLADSTDLDTLEKETGWSIHELTLGSAVFGAQTLLAQHCLEQTKEKPQAIYFFVTKDDFNLNGSRARVSREYFKAIERPTWKDLLAARLPVHSCRASIRLEAKGVLFRLKKRLTGSREQAQAEPALDTPLRDLSNDYRTAYLADLGENYELEARGFEQLRQLHRAYPDVCLLVVLPPITGAPVRWQKEFCPRLDWPAVKTRLELECDQAGVQLLDFSELYPSDTTLFKDVYHLNARGRQQFTQVFGQELRQRLAP